MATKYEEQGKKMAARARAHGRALSRLRDLHPQEFQNFYAEEVRKAFEEVGLPLRQATVRKSA